MKLATFNIYWLGNERFVEMSGLEPRGNDDWLSIARVISRLDSDVIVFEEIVSIEELQKVLDFTRDFIHRRYQIYDKQGQLLGTGKAGDQKVVLAYDEQQYELVAASPIFGGEGRLPFGLRLRSTAQKGEILVIGVHFKSGQPEFENKPSAEKRARQCQHLADWVAGRKTDSNPVLPKPGEHEHVAILGDFNAICQLETGQPEGWQIVVDSASYNIRFLSSLVHMIIQLERNRRVCKQNA